MLRRTVQELGLQLVGGLLLLGASLWAFGVLVEDLVTKDTVHLDRRFAAWLHEHATSALTDFFQAVTVLGNAVTLVPLTVAACGYLAWRGSRAELVLVALAFAGAEILTLGLKLGFQRERPFFPDPLATESTFSFPSGHATVSIAVYGALALVAVRRVTAWRARAAVLTATALLVVLIGFSRLYLGVHYLSDVLAGLSAGLAWLALCLVALDLHKRRPLLRRRRAQTSR